jgi:hypothetical protein
MHYKQQSYRVTGLALHEEDNEPYVIYQAEYDDHITWARPISSWVEEVEIGGKLNKKSSHRAALRRYVCNLGDNFPSLTQATLTLGCVDYKFGVREVTTSGNYGPWLIGATELHLGADMISNEKFASCP